MEEEKSFIMLPDPKIEDDKWEWVKDTKNGGDILKLSFDLYQNFRDYVEAKAIQRTIDKMETLDKLLTDIKDRNYKI